MGRNIDRIDLGDVPAAMLHNPGGVSPVLLVCEHASNRIPPHLDGLGLDQDTQNSHIAWDPGALAVAQKMSNLLDARLVASTVSRLVYDCNRPPQAPGAMPARSEIHDVPGNTNLTDIEKTERISKVYNPFRNMVSDTLTASAKPPVLVTIHSFTPVYMGQQRTVDIGILHDDDSRLADAMLALAPDRTGLNIRRNDPYGPEDGVTHTLKLHALPRGLLNVMIEIRNDLIATTGQQLNFAKILAELIADALAAISSEKEAQCHA